MGQQTAKSLLASPIAFYGYAPISDWSSMNKHINNNLLNVDRIKEWL